jgi:serine/threonine protein kinase
MTANDPRERERQRTVLLPSGEQAFGLQPGHPLQEFRIERLLGVGGTSVVYAARDTKLSRRVAIKEYLPASLGTRAPDGEVMPRLPRFADLYGKGLQSFIAEARMLGSLDHPALVKVYRFWPQNGTAYMAMPLYEGLLLSRFLAESDTPPGEPWLRALASALMDALEVMHAQKCYHRDIAPENILMQFDAKGPAAGSGVSAKAVPRPVLLDLSAARRVISDATRTLTASVRNGFSPAEQYESDAPQRQGAWTDVYALSAVLYAAAVGAAPPSAIARVVRDEYVPAAKAAAGRYGTVFLEAIDAGLGVEPARRPQTIQALRALMNRVPAAAGQAAPAPKPPKPPKPPPSPQPQTAPVTSPTEEVDLLIDSTPAPLDASPAAGGRGGLKTGAAALVVVALVIIGWLWLRPR